ncbi:ankyrin protein [Fusarium bulbicola]|nr:ankyrin protein [Fusarium bulbicola]
MKPYLSFLAAAFASPFADAEYTVKIPEDAVWVTTWELFHAEAPKFDQMLDEKYGGFVVEVDNKIVLATNEEMTNKLDIFFKEMEAKDVDAEEEPQISKKRGEDLFALRRRKSGCSHAGCFEHPTFLTYTGCHYCLKRGSAIYRRGWCI